VVAAAVALTACVATPAARVAGIEPVALAGESFAVARYDTSAPCTHDFRAEALLVSADGDVEWRMDVPWTPYPTPVIRGGVALTGGNTDVVAFDSASGTPVWQITDLPGSRLVEAADGVYLTIREGGITGAIVRIDPATGEPDWSFFPDQETASVVVSDGDRLFLTDGGDVGAIDASTGVTVWRQSTDQAVTPPMPVGDVVIQWVFPDVVTGLAAATGDPLWRVGIETDVIEALALSAGVVVAMAADVVVGLEPGSGERLWSTELQAGDVAMAGKDAIRVHRGHVIETLDARTGAVTGTLPASGEPGPVVAADGFVADVVDGVWRLRPDDGAWEARIGSAHSVVPLLVGDRLVVAVDEAVDDISGDGQGRLVAFDSSDGSLQWNVDTRDGIGVEPVPVGDDLLVVAADRALGC
jgi:outer membrane protein assembly factor BamB